MLALDNTFESSQNILCNETIHQNCYVLKKNYVIDEDGLEKIGITYLFDNQIICDFIKGEDIKLKENLIATIQNLTSYLETSNIKIKHYDIIPELIYLPLIKTTNGITKLSQKNDASFSLIFTKNFLLVNNKKIHGKGKILITEKDDVIYLENNFLKNGMFFLLINFFPKTFKKIQQEKAALDLHNSKVLLHSFSIRKGIIYGPKNYTRTIPSGKVLDLGCGNFEYAEDFNTDVIGIDASCRPNKKNFIPGDISRENVWNALPNDTFDLITSFSVLHWINDLDFVFEMMYKKLKKDGLIVHLILTKFNLNIQALNYILYGETKDEIDSFITRTLARQKNPEQNFVTESLIKIDKDFITQLCNRHNFKIRHLKTYKRSILYDGNPLIEYIRSFFRPKIEILILEAYK